MVWIKITDKKGRSDTFRFPKGYTLPELREAMKEINPDIIKVHYYYPKKRKKR